MEKHEFAALDVGAHEVKLVVAEVLDNKKNIIASVSVPSKGFKDGNIIDPAEVTNCIVEAKKIAEKTVRKSIKRVFLSVPLQKALIQNTDVTINVSNESGIISKKNIADLIHLNRSRIKNPNIFAVNVLPVRYFVNDIEVGSPIGISGSKLSMFATQIIVPSNNLNNMLIAVEQAKLEVVEVCSIPVAQMFESFTEEEYLKKTALIDFGYTSSSLTIFANGIPQYTQTFDFGGENIEKSIQSRYNIDLVTAKNILFNFSKAYSADASVDEKIIVRVDDEQIEITEFDISQIIQNEFLGFLQKVKKEVSTNAGDAQHYIFIGGLAQIEGLDKLAIELYNRSSRVYIPKVIGARDSKFTTCLGLISFADFMRDHMLDEEVQAFDIKEVEIAESFDDAIEEEHSYGFLDRILLKLKNN